MGKMMISLSQEAENMVRKHIDVSYYNKVGALSLFFEKLIREFFAAKKKEKAYPSAHQATT